MAFITFTTLATFVTEPGTDELRIAPQFGIADNGSCYFMPNGAPAGQIATVRRDGSGFLRISRAIAGGGSDALEGDARPVEQLETIVGELREKPGPQVEHPLTVAPRVVEKPGAAPEHPRLRAPTVRTGRPVHQPEASQHPLRHGRPVEQPTATTMPLADGRPVELHAPAPTALIEGRPVAQPAHTSRLRDNGRLEPLPAAFTKPAGPRNRHPEGGSV